VSERFEAVEIEATDGTVLSIEVDVTDHEPVTSMVARVVEAWGRFDVLVANAGGGRGRPMDTKPSTLDPALLQLLVEMNLFGTVYKCNAVAPIMKQQRSGKIITVSSVAGTAPSAEDGYALWRSESRYRPLYSVSGPGSRAVRHHR
jgi:3-oxoacyl-[acyl-carrier protein] reductase